ncbi:uncharacterized protein G2W53_030526 [Senna tora]|uniref:Uncharacterized protein n=1 Tax=Senna tora TaxID=362788 RepID=A0A834T9C2_9FABA|nr:uncharacterized protein G2W53_030526 [Senna tora]
MVFEVLERRIKVTVNWSLRYWGGGSRYYGGLFTGQHIFDYNDFLQVF